MSARPYFASGQSNPGAILRLIVICLCVALVAGLVEGVISHWISLVVLFPLVLGGAVGFAAVKVIDRSHVRAPWVALAVAGAAGLVAQLAVHGVQYAQFRSELSSEFKEHQQEVGVMDKQIDDLIEQDSGHPGFLGYMLIRARVGTEIKHNGSGGLKLTGTGFWILLAINFLIAGGVAANQGFQRARAPYCDPCQRWYDRSELVARGSANKRAVGEVRQAIDQGTFDQLPAAVGTAQPGSVSLVQLLRCSACKDHEPQLSITLVTGSAKKQATKIAYKTMLRADEAQRVLSAFSTASAEGPAAKT